MAKMSRFATGLIAGGLIGVIGLSYAVNDKRTRKKMIKDGKKLLNKAGDAVDGFSERIW